MSETFVWTPGVTARLIKPIDQLSTSVLEHNWDKVKSDTVCPVWRLVDQDDTSDIETDYSGFWVAPSMDMKPPATKDELALMCWLRVVDDRGDMTFWANYFEIGGLSYETV